MLADKPLISITMATHDRPKLLLERSIPSVLRQTYDNWELLVRGDGASKETELVVDSFGDPRIGYKNLPRHSCASAHEQWCVGGTRALNDALEDASGTYTAHLDDDDEFLPNHLETLSKILTSGNYDFAYGRVHFETDEGWIVFGEPFDERRLQGENLMAHSSVMYNRAKLGHHRYDIEGIEPGDWRMWKRMMAAGARFGFTDEVVAIHYAEDRFRRMERAKAWYKAANLVRWTWFQIQEQGLFGFANAVVRKAPVKALVRGISARQLVPAPPVEYRRVEAKKSNKIKVSVGNGIRHGTGTDWAYTDLPDKTCGRIKLPYEENYAELAYSEHTIEHLTPAQAQAFFRECYRILRPSGVIRLATTDLVYQLLNSFPPRRGIRVPDSASNRQVRFLWDELTLRRHLEHAGFASIERCRLGHSRHAELRCLETRTDSRLILEAEKPDARQLCARVRGSC